jgi:hypothetical protein
MRTNEDGLRPVAASTPTRMPAGGEAVGTLFRIIHCGQRRRSSLQLVPAQQVGRPLTANRRPPLRTSGILAKPHAVCQKRVVGRAWALLGTAAGRHVNDQPLDHDIGDGCSTWSCPTISQGSGYEEPQYGRGLALVGCLAGLGSALVWISAVASAHLLALLLIVGFVIFASGFAAFILRQLRN